MVNLLKFRDRAVYKDGRETDLSGREAYEIYGQAVSQYIRFGEFCLLETSRISPSAKSMICGMRLRSLSIQTGRDGLHEYVRGVRAAGGSPGSRTAWPTKHRNHSKRWYSPVSE